MDESVQRDGEQSPSIDEKTSTTVSAQRAIRGGILGNYADQFDIFLPVIALAPVAVAVFGEVVRRHRLIRRPCGYCATPHEKRHPQCGS